MNSFIWLSSVGKLDYWIKCYPKFKPFIYYGEARIVHAFSWRRQVWYELWCYSKWHVKNLSFILQRGGAYDKFLLLVELTFIQNAFLYVYKDFRPFFIVHVSFSAWKSWEDVQSLIHCETLCKFCDYEATDLHWTLFSDIHDWFVFRSNRWRELYITLLYWICS